MSRVNLGTGSSKNFRGGGMVKKTGVKKYVAGGIVAGAAKELGKKSLKAGKKLFEKSTKRKGRPPKSKMAKAKSRVNLGAADPVSAGGYVAGGYALGDSGEKPVKKAAGGAVKNIQDPQKFAPIDRLGMTAEQRRQQREMVKSFREYFAKDKKKKK